jgi:hypothetical protein
MKLKLLFWLLLVGNVVLFGMSRGYFGANASERREPQRLAEQLRPELLSVLPANSEKLASQLRAQPRRRRRPLPTCDGGRSARRGRPGGNPATASPAQPAAAQVATVTPSCTEVGNFTAADARRFSDQLASLKLGDKVVRS